MKKIFLIVVLCGNLFGLQKGDDLDERKNQIIYSTTPVSVPGLYKGVVLRLYPAFLRMDNEIFYCFIFSLRQIPNKLDWNDQRFDLYAVEKLPGAFAVFTDTLIDRVRTIRIDREIELLVGTVNVFRDGMIFNLFKQLSHAKLSLK